MKEELLSYLKVNFNFEFANSTPLEKYFILERRNRNDLLIKEGFCNQEIFLIIDGYLRAYHISESGKEVTTEIYGKGEMVSSIYSLLKKSPSNVNVQCITKCKLYRISNASFVKLRTMDPIWFQLGFNILKTKILKKEDRILGFTNLRAKNRYIKLILENQDIIKNVPIQYIASYLGMKPESLSRIRRQLAIS